MYKEMDGCYTKQVYKRRKGKIWENFLFTLHLPSALQLQSINSDADGHSFFFRAPASKYPFTLQHPTPNSRHVPCPVHCVYCATVLYCYNSHHCGCHYLVEVKWNLKTLADALQSHSFLAGLQGHIYGFSTAFFFFLPDTSPSCPKKRHMSHFALRSPRFYLLCLDL